jgi:vitamin B12 transporter
MPPRFSILAGAIALALASARAGAAPGGAAPNGAAPDGAAPGSAAAADSQNTVVVTATRLATAVDALAVPVIVISREEIERSLSTDLAALLTGQPGVEVASAGGPGQPAAVFLRGTDSDQTTVLIDGVRVNPGTLGGAPIQNIQPESIDHVEIVKGARSSLYGTDAIGGVINVITRAGGAPGASLYASTGRYGTQVYAANANGMLGERVGAGANLAYQRSDGFPPLQGSTAPGDYDNFSGNALLRYAATDALSLRAQLWHSSGKSAYSEFGGPADENFLDASYAAGADWHGGEGASARLTASRVVTDVTQRQTPDFDSTRRDALDGQYSWRPWQGHQATLGAVIDDEHTQSLSYGTPYDVHTHSQLGFAQDQLHHGANDLLLALGYQHHEVFGSYTTWNAEYVRTLSAALRATLAAGTAFRAPDSTDLYGYGGNPALRPETSQQVQLGLNWQPTGSQELLLSLYQNRIDDLIEFVLIDPVNFIYQTQNVSQARIRGAELGYEWRGAAWSLHGSYVAQDPRNLTTGGQLLRRSHSNLMLGARWVAGALDASADLQLVGPRTDYVGFDLGSVAGYTLLNFGLGYRFNPDWSAQLRLDNALDRKYEQISGYNTAGRSLTLAMRFHMR